MNCFGCLIALSAVQKSFVPPLSQVVVYEANVRAFEPHAGFRRVDSALTRIKSLGVNVLWLMPVQPVGKLRSAGGLGSPYATQDFDSVNPEFGTPAELRQLVSDAHQRGIAVILDWVADHTSWDSGWIKSHPDWFLHDADGRIEVPPGTGWNDVAALDYRKPEMRMAMIRSMKGWIENYGVDGFRCDSADRIPFDFWKSAISDLRHSTTQKLLMLAEGFRTDDYTAGFDLTYGWNFNGRLREAFSGKDASLAASSNAFEKKEIPLGARRLRFITNHDIDAFEGSPVELYKSVEGEKTAFTIAALSGGAPLIYSGEEAGWEERVPIFEDSKIDWEKDPSRASWIAALIRLRADHLSLQSPNWDDHSNKDLVFFHRTVDQDESIVLGNVRPTPATADVPIALQGEWRDGIGRSPYHLGSQLTLPPYGHLVLVKRSHPL